MTWRDESIRRAEGVPHHNTVRVVESLLDTVAMVNVNVNIKDSLVVLEQLEDAENAVIYVAKTGRLGCTGDGTGGSGGGGG